MEALDAHRTDTVVASNIHGNSNLLRLVWSTTISLKTRIGVPLHPSSVTVARTFASVPGRAKHLETNDQVC